MLENKPIDTSSEPSAKVGAPASQSPTVKPFRLGYRPGLNGLRGLAILVVLYVHAVRYPPSCLGFMAVDVFFVLSGFLITCLLIEEWEESRRVSLVSFYMRRALRLFPALAMLLGAFAIYSICTHSNWQHKSDMIELRATALYYLNWGIAFRSISPIYLGHAWSLSIEEQFYLLWPPLLFLLLRWTDRRSLLNFILLGIFCVTGWRWLSLAIEQGSVDPWRMINGLDMRADALLIGCATAVVVSSDYVAQWGWSKKALQTSLIISLFGLAFLGVLCDVSQPWMYCIGWSLMSVFAAAIIIALMAGAAGRMRPFFEARWLVFVGMISYSLYLWHYLIFMTLRRDFHVSQGTSILPGSFLSFAAALGSYYLIERPCLRLKKRFKKVKD